MILEIPDIPDGMPNPEPLARARDRAIAALVLGKGMTLAEAAATMRNVQSRADDFARALAQEVAGA